ncbi:hypothetical protein AAE478_009340 [Parahypoxylon ruwenzoriense]
MNERTSKIMHPYSQHRAGSQQPTPPSTSRPWQNYQINAHCSQSASPIALQPSAADILEMHGIEASHSPGDHGHMVTEPPFQWGQYTVSSTEAPDDMSSEMAHTALFSVPSIAPTDLVRPQITLNSSHMSLPTQTHVPILHQSPDPRDLAPSVTPIDNMHHHFPSIAHHPQVIMDFATYKRKSSKSSRNGRLAGRSGKRPRAQSRATSKRCNMTSTDGQKAPSTDNSTSNSKGLGRNITLKPGASEQDRFILQLRCEMDNDKGKGIWEEITKKYEERFGKRRQESLQMNLTRAVLKFVEWPAFEDEALIHAVEELDRRRYSDLAKLMKEKYGGCQAWEWKEGHILKRLVELGLEEFDPDDVKKPRRKKRTTGKRPSDKQPWTNPGAPFPCEEDARTVTSEQEKYILEHYCKPDTESPDPDVMLGVVEHPHSLSNRGSIDRELMESRSGRVAKQTCEQLLAKGNDQIYGALSMDENHHRMS